MLAYNKAKNGLFHFYGTISPSLKCLNGTNRLKPETQLRLYGKLY